MSKEHPFVSLQYQALYMKTYVHSIFASNIIVHRSIVVQQSVFLYS